MWFFCQLSASALLLSHLGVYKILNLCCPRSSAYLTCCLFSFLVIVNVVRFLWSVRCCSLYCAVLTEYRIKGEMWKAGWFLQERSVKECEGVWWNVVVVTPDQ